MDSLVLLWKQDRRASHFSYVGYQNEKLDIDLTENKSLTIQLSPSVALQAIEISAEREELIQEKTQMSQMTVPIEQLKGTTCHTWRDRCP